MCWWRPARWNARSALPGNDVPGVMLAPAVRDFIDNYGVAPGRRIVVVTNNDDAIAPRWRRWMRACGAGGDRRPRQCLGALPDAVRAWRQVLTGTGIAGSRAAWRSRA